ncbi:MAG: hypothetical protein HY901_29000 [Deltaproteobacteria bacterium]|nr:hypothetical protein [Deltaproteobacteria bacterium]
MRRALLLLVVTMLLALPRAASAAESEVSDAQRAQVEALRAQVAADIQLQTYDLLDELVLGWTRQPVFANPTQVVLADVSIPVGFGSGLEALVENHFLDLVIKNPSTRLAFTHCPQCLALVVHSGAKGTVVARGFDAPEVLEAAGAYSGSRHALFLDFEIEGASLVLRARITGLEPALPIVWAKTLSTSTSSPALLRSPERLKSASEARQEYLEALQGRGVWTFPLRIGVHTYPGRTDGSMPLGIAPFIWLQAGAELALTQARAWMGNLMIGASWAPELHTAWMAQGRVSRLLTGSVSSLTAPDLYAFLGMSVTSVTGNNALAFQDQTVDMEQLQKQIQEQLLGMGAPEAHALFPSFQLGRELRGKNRISIVGLVESLPTRNDAVGLGDYLDLGLFKIQSLGVEVSFCF